MGSLVSIFHLNLGLFIAQLVNFAIVFAVLYWLVFKPLVKVMAERSQKIEKSLKNADEVEKRLTATVQEREAVIAFAKKQANLIVEEADKNGERRRQELLAQAKEDIGQVINGERAKLVREKADTLQEIKKEVADLVVLTVEKFLSEKLTNEQDRRVIKKMLK